MVTEQARESLAIVNIQGAAFDAALLGAELR